MTVIGEKNNMYHMTLSLDQDDHLHLENFNFKLCT